jgi:hypothetical protein
LQKNNVMLLYCSSISPRLKYISDFIGKEISGTAFQLTTDVQVYQHYPDVKINYTNQFIAGDKCWVEPHSLLFEKGLQSQQITCFDNNGNKAFFPTTGDFPFDIFAASFYLLSRYEEYLLHKKDMYGRFAHEQSLAFKENFLQKPLINIWIEDLKGMLQNAFQGFQPPPQVFKFLPTYDIDEAYSYKHKDWWRSAGAVIKSLLKGQWNKVALRRKVLNNQVPDPFDSYDWMDNLHRPHKFKPRYFFLVPGKIGKHDRNILPGESALQVLIKKHAENYEIGVHPSWQSGDKPDLIKTEIQTIQHITQLKITASRQHFIRFVLPETFRHLIAAGIKEDYSMGYGSINGFRASVASPFYWYDLEKEETTYLLLYPFCYMEANSYYEQHHSPQQALEEMRQYYLAVKNVNGVFISIWHNTFLGTEERFAGWREVYQQFIAEISH